MIESKRTVRLSLVRSLAVPLVALVTYMVMVFVTGDIGSSFKLDKFAYWYFNGLAPFFDGLIATIAGGLCALEYRRGGWGAAVAITLVFGGLFVALRDLDPTDRPLWSLAAMLIGIACALFVLHHLRRISRSIEIR
jgi:peptidoglycan/LPS O-acetylase OafA/YrhL